MACPAPTALPTRLMCFGYTLQRLSPQSSSLRVRPCERPPCRLAADRAERPAFGRHRHADAPAEFVRLPIRRDDLAAQDIRRFASNARVALPGRRVLDFDKIVLVWRQD